MLVVSLFLDWWEDLTAFTVFEALDLVLLTLAIGTVLALAEEAGLRLPRTAATGRALPLAAIALAVVLTQLVNDPPLVLGRSGPGHATGIWLALAGAVLMTGGALFTATRISLAVDVRRRDTETSEAETVFDARADPPPPDEPKDP
jgi:hypothetical protein